MTRAEKIRQAWGLNSIGWNPRHGPLKLPLPIDVDAIAPIEPMAIPADFDIGTTVVFTFDYCSYVYQHEFYEWWNVICEGKIIDYVVDDHRNL